MTRDISWHGGDMTPSDRSQARIGFGHTIWMTGLSGSGKSTIARRVESRLISQGRAAYVLDGDNLRHALNSDLGFSPEDRAENVRRVGEVARLMADAGLVVLAPVISPYAGARSRVEQVHEASGLAFSLVYVSTPLETCESRDVKGLYARARAGELTNFTGINAPYEPPHQPDLTIDTTRVSVDAATESVLSLLR